MVTTLIAWVSTTFAISTVAATFAINFALSLIVTRVFGQSPQGPQDSGTRQQVPPSNVNAIPIVYGDAYLGGTFVDAVLSENQKAMYYVMAISCISPNGQFTFDTTDMYYGDRKITFDATDKAKVVSLTDEAGNVDTKINGYLWIGLYTSTLEGAIASPNWYAPNVIMGPGTPFTDYPIDSTLQWPSTGRQMNGTAFAIAMLIYNQEAGTTNLSPITFKVKQALFGTGVAKPGDVWADYISNMQYGAAVASVNVDVASAIALNAYSDELIPFRLAGPFFSEQPRYRMNGVLDAGQTVLSNLDKIMTCCDSWMAYNAALGQWSVVINKPESVVYSFDDDNIIGEVRVTATDITQSINQVEAKFPDKGARDQPNFVNIATPSNLLYPNEPNNKYSVTYDLCNDSVQAQYLANRVLEQAREDLIVSFSTSYYGIQVDAGSVVSVTNSDYGWSNKLFRVVKVNEASLSDGSLGAKLEMTEYSPAVYDNFDITQYAPVPNSDIPSVSYFSPLSAPTISSSNPSSAIPNFNVSISIPATGRVTYSELYYTTAAIPSPNDWKLLSVASAIDGQPVTPSSTYVFSNQVLPTGASTTATYYFSYIVGNDLARSTRSPTSAAFTWTPVANTGPTGPTGTLGPTGATGATGGAGSVGPRSASGYLYYYLASASAPSAPSASGYDFTNGTFSSLTSGWSTTFTAPDPVTNPSTQDGSKFWAVRYNVSESTFGGFQTVTLTSVFNWQNLDGLVTFTNLAAPSGTTFIDGGNIKTNTINANTIIAGLLKGFTLQAGSGGFTPSGSSFEVTSTGVVWSDNLFCKLGFFQNATNSISPPMSAYTAGNVEAVAGIAVAANANGAAHGVRGTNFRLATSGLVGVANGYDFYADGSGTNYGPFTGTHDSLVLIGEDFTVGDIVVDQQTIERNGVSSTISLVRSSTSANQSGAVGIVCKAPSPLADQKPSVFIESIDNVDGKAVVVMKPSFYAACEIYNFMPMNSVGEGQVNVCGEGGNIQIGDLICTSSIAGKGMKQSDDLIHQYTVAKARESVVFSSPTDVQMIACIYLAG